MNYRTFTGINANAIPSKLAEPFTDQRAYKQVPGGADLTDINTGHMIERITEVFGPKGLGWSFDYDKDDMELLNPESKRPTARLRYAVFSYKLIVLTNADQVSSIETFKIPTSGVSTNSIEYAEEGARTSALGAALKGMCFQLPVYKNELDHHGNQKAPAGRTNGGKTETKAEVKAEVKTEGNSTLTLAIFEREIGKKLGLTKEQIAEAFRGTEFEKKFDPSKGREMGQVCKAYLEAINS